MRARVLAVLITLVAGGCEQLPEGFDFTESDQDAKAAQLVRVAEITRAGGDLVNAVSLYARVAEMRPDWPDPVLAMGETAYAMGDFAAARDAYARALDLDALDTDERVLAAVGLGRSLLRLGAFEDALLAFDTAPSDARAIGGGGVALDLLGRHDQARDRYASGLEAFPDDAALRTNLGFSLALSELYGEAVAVLEEAARLAGAGPRTRQNLALVHGLRGDAQAARALLSVDLDAAAVANNLAVYDHLRTLDPQARRQAVFGLGGVIVSE